MCPSSETEGIDLRHHRWFVFKTFPISSANTACQGSCPAMITSDMSLRNVRILRQAGRSSYYVRKETRGQTACGYIVASQDELETATPFADPKNEVTLPGGNAPPCYSMAISPKQGSDDKISAGLTKLNEGKSFTFSTTARPNSRCCPAWAICSWTCSAQS